MLSDIVTVMWKEMREILFPDGRFQGGARNVLIFLGIAVFLFEVMATVAGAPRQADAQA